MPGISGSAVVAANTRSGNLLAGEQFEFVPAPAIVTISLSGSAAGLEADATIGGTSVLNAADFPATNRFPIRPDDTMTRIGALAGERIFLSANNTTAGALTANFLVDIDPL